jgi:hypothetical protein
MASGLVDRELRPSLNALGGTFSVHPTATSLAIQA